MLKLYFKVVEDQKRFSNEDQKKKKKKKKKIREMKKEENEVQTDKNEILKICAHFCTELYSSTPLTKEYQPRLIKSPTDHDNYLKLRKPRKK